MLTPSVFLCAVCLLCFSVYTFSGKVSDDQSPRDDLRKKKLSVLFLTGIFVGHHFPLLALGEELVNRGHRAAILGPLIEGSSVLSNLTECVGVEFINAGFIPKFAFEVASKMGKNVNIVTLLIRGRQLQKEADRSYNFLALLKDGVDLLNPQDWDFVVVDNAAVAIMYYIMQQWNMDRVMMNMSPLGSAMGAPPAWPSPGMMSGLSANMSFKDRVKNKILGFMFKLLTPIISRFMESDEMDLGVDYFSNMGLFHPMLINTVMGFDYPITRPPLAHYVGPMLMKMYPPLNPELSDWLEKKERKSVVYISMGSTAELTPELGRGILNGVIAPHNYSVVWALRESNRDILEGTEIDSERVFLAGWVSQGTLLQHHTVAMAILHCGLGGVQEALYNKVPVICVPYGYDQFDVALRLEYQGLGIRILPTEVTQETVSDAVGSVGSGRFQKGVDKISVIMKATGGARTAADLVELYAEVGHQHGIPSFMKYKWSWVQYYNVDVWAVLLCVVAVTVWVCVMCIKCCWRRLCYKNRSLLKSKKE